MKKLQEREILLTAKCLGIYHLISAPETSPQAPQQPTEQSVAVAEAAARKNSSRPPLRLQLFRYPFPNRGSGSLSAGVSPRLGNTVEHVFMATPSHMAQSKFPRRGAGKAKAVAAGQAIHAEEILYPLRNKDPVAFCGSSHAAAIPAHVNSLRSEKPNLIILSSPSPTLPATLGEGLLNDFHSLPNKWSQPIDPVADTFRHQTRSSVSPSGGDNRAHDSKWEESAAKASSKPSFNRKPPPAIRPGVHRAGGESRIDGDHFVPVPPLVTSPVQVPSSLPMPPKPMPSRFPYSKHHYWKHRPGPGIHGLRRSLGI